MRRRLVVAFAVLATAASVSGCGGPMTPGELSRSIQTLESTAAEGAMLAGDVADDRTKATFARVHARDMSDVVVHEAEKLNDAQADQANVAAAKTKAIDLADKIDTALGQIQVAPDDAPGARKAATQLDQLSKQAVIFSIPVLPLTYLPILLVGNDRSVMGAHVNGPIARVLGWFYFGLICVLAVAAPILFVWTNGGS